MLLICKQASQQEDDAGEDIVAAQLLHDEDDPYPILYPEPDPYWTFPTHCFPSNKNVIFAEFNKP